MEFTQDILDIKRRFDAAGKELFLVGGCVRDMVLEHKVTDFDFATNASAEEVGEILKGFKFELQGAHFGVMRVFTETGDYEIASYREDITFGRKPEVKLGVTINEDARRRDFTINALYYDITKKEIIDIVYGLNDLENKVIRTTGPAKLIFSQDKLRVLRAVRFKNKIGGTYHQSVIDAIEEDNTLIGLNSGGEMEPIHQNRIIEEFTKGIKQAVKTSQYIDDLKTFGLLEQIFKMKYTWGPSVDSKVVEIVVARLLVVCSASVAEKQSMFVEKLVQECLFDTQTAMGIAFLLKVQKVDEDSAFQLEKMRARTRITKEHIAEFRQLLSGENDENIRAFEAYKISVDGTELAKKFQGPEIGKEQHRLEKEIFIELRNGTKATT